VAEKGKSERIAKKLTDFYRYAGPRLKEL
jgi:hypothetical protein